MPAESVDLERGPVPAGTRVETALCGTVITAVTLPAAPPGYRRCWWCCAGALVDDDDGAVAEHRYARRPDVADPGRARRERTARVDRAVSAEAAEAAARRPGRAMIADILTRPF
ncbi:MAG: hypothetical protein KGQ66_13120 [Acidobacteriota bacterium]|nr:hypothetical protein [Acidobacteriota bacterium]